VLCIDDTWLMVEERVPQEWRCTNQGVAPLTSLSLNGFTVSRL